MSYASKPLELIYSVYDRTVFWTDFKKFVSQLEKDITSNPSLPGDISIVRKEDRQYGRRLEVIYRAGCNKEACRKYIQNLAPGNITITPNEYASPECDIVDILYNVEPTNQSLGRKLKNTFIPVSAFFIKTVLLLVFLYILLQTIKVNKPDKYDTWLNLQ